MWYTWPEESGPLATEFCIQWPDGAVYVKTSLLTLMDVILIALARRAHVRSKETSRWFLRLAVGTCSGGGGVPESGTQTLYKTLKVWAEKALWDVPF